MTSNYPIYTMQTQCNDCYKCVRHCPVKAIRIDDGQANIISENCVACGTCVLVCPAKAKAVRSDVENVKKLLSSPSTPVYLSLAPTWISSFHGITPSQLVQAATKLGFAGVSETALGAEEVSAHIAQMMMDKPGLYISSACPAAISYIRHYLPEYTNNITPFMSPAQAHAQLLRKTYGAGVNVVFAGPCIAKKLEADRHPHVLQAALTFAELKDLLALYRLSPDRMQHDPEIGFVPHASKDGSLYPVEGGMMKTIQNRAKNAEYDGIYVSGIAAIETTLKSFDPAAIAGPVFIEALACTGGCINGPMAVSRQSVLNRRLNVTDYVKNDRDVPGESLNIDITAKFVSAPVAMPEPTEAELKAALLSIGKVDKNDELNCGGCGYDSCRQLAKALVCGYGEPRMCVSYMRRLAQKKANALLTTMPHGVVLIDKNMDIIDSNRRFASIFGEDNLLAFDVSPGLRGCKFDKIAPFGDVVREVLETGEEKMIRHMRHKNSLLDIAIFIIEAHQVIGAIVDDVTMVEMERGEIAKRANEVINKNIQTVQDIACALGEHMAETEILLRSIAEGFGNDNNLFDTKEFKALNKNN